MTDKQIKLDGSWIPIEEAIKARLISEKDIDVPSKQIIIDGVDVSKCQEYTCIAYRCKTACGQYKCMWRYERMVKLLREQLKAKEQECEEKQKTAQDAISKLCAEKSTLCNELDQLKAEVKSKTEYIQEQRDIINQYSKEIEMYKKCQGKRASKREEELKAENEKLKDIVNKLLDERNKYLDKWSINLIYKQALQEIKEIVEIENNDIKVLYNRRTYQRMKQILQKISEVENGNK